MLLFLQTIIDLLRFIGTSVQGCLHLLRTIHRLLHTAQETDAAARQFLPVIGQIHHVLLELKAGQSTPGPADPPRDRAYATRDILRLLEEIANNTATLAEAPAVAETTSTSPPEKLMGAEEVMDYLGITKTTYYRLIKNGELTPRRKGRRHYYYRRDLQTALAESVRRGRV